MEEPRKRNNMLRNAILAAAMIGSLYVGDRFRPINRLQEKAFYHNASIEDGYYQKPLNLEIVDRRNEKNRIEVYLVDVITKDSLEIQENMHVGTMGESIDDFVDDKRSGIKKWWEEQKADSTSMLYKIRKKLK